MKDHSEGAYREAIEATGDLMVHTHSGGQFERRPDGSVALLPRRGQPPGADYRAFLKAAREIVGYHGHIGYELCSPVLIRHRHAGLDYALLQTELACQVTRRIINSLETAP